MKRCGCDNEKICFIFDESNVLSSAFLERMNALLASGEVPGLFEEEEFAGLMSECRQNFEDEDDEELFRCFTRNVQRNLHVVFTMNPANAELNSRAATSPALFNRCVVDWFGSWSRSALAQVGSHFLAGVVTEADVVVDIHESAHREHGRLPGSLGHVVKLHEKKRSELEKCSRT